MRIKGHGAIAVEGHDIKLGRGGIRDIEFFAQTQQLIAGGRHPELRTRGTIETLGQLAARRLDCAGKPRASSPNAYLFLRRVENRLQMVGDQQTHIIPCRAATSSQGGEALRLCRHGRFRRRADRRVQAQSRRITARCSRSCRPRRISAPSIVCRLDEGRPGRAGRARAAWFPQSASWPSPRSVPGNRAATPPRGACGHASD